MVAHTYSIGSIGPRNTLAFVPDAHEDADHLDPTLGRELLAFLLREPFVLDA